MAPLSRRFYAVQEILQHPDLGAPLAVGKHQLLAVRMEIQIGELIDRDSQRLSLAAVRRNGPDFAAWFSLWWPGVNEDVLPILAPNRVTVTWYQGRVLPAVQLRCRATASW